jgi:hypothetical protein
MRITLALSTFAAFLVALGAGVAMSDILFLLAAVLLTAGYFKLKARARLDSTRFVTRGDRW